MRLRLALIASLLIPALAVGQPALAQSANHRYIVVLKPGADLGAVLASHAKGTTLIGTYSAVNGYAARLTPKALAEAQSDPQVLFVSADRAVQSSDQTTPTGVARIGAAGGFGVAGNDLAGTGVGVAVIDTGVDAKHPDLTPVQQGKNCVDHYQNSTDKNGHGTAVAGIVAARDNTIGVVGVAPGATIYALKALDDSGNGYWSSVICAVDWTMQHPGLVRVANLSLEGSGTSTPSNLDCTNSNKDALHYAICLATKVGITFVAAAGNGASDAANTVPAAYDEVIAVSAIADSDGRPGGLGPAPSCISGQTDDYFATFSNFGSVVDLAAPGVCILSTFTGGGYATMSGTSMAAPHVTGAAARYIQTHPAATPGEVRAALIASAEPGPIPGDPAPHEGVVHVSSPTSSPTAGTQQQVAAGTTGQLPVLPAVPLLPALPALPAMPALPLG